MLIIHNTSSAERDRTEEFARLAQARQAGTITIPPLLLPNAERRLYVRETLREDHRFRIRNRPEGAQAKFDKLSESLFKFFRGTALLYYRDYAGDDLHLPHVLTIGDVHPENYGVMPNEDGAPFFGLNDFDEAYVAPFTYDVKRGAVGFYIAARANGLAKKKRKTVVRRFVKGYVDGLREFAQDDREKWHEWRIDNSPTMIRELLRDTQKPRAQFLEKWIDLEKERFVSTEEIVPHSRYLDKFQKLIDTYCKENQIDRKHKAKDFFTVKDVAIKKGSGTASLGLDRFFVLLEGPTAAADDDLILELKQARHSALHGLVDAAEQSTKGEAARIVRSHEIHLAGGDAFYGQVEIDGQSFLVRERSPYKDEIDIDALDQDELCHYAQICGQILAQTHARSDEDTGIMEGNAETRILAAIHYEAFCADITRFAHTATKRIKRDYKTFQKDHKLGIFYFSHDE
jgi:uncharacterized protein (DUF2252 family)